MISLCLSPHLGCLIPAASPRKFGYVFKGAHNKGREENFDSLEADVSTILHFRKVWAFMPTCDIIECGNHVVLSPKTNVAFRGGLPEITSHVFHL